MMKLSVSSRAYAKILLHACKYPFKAVNGVLLADSNTNKDNAQVCDAIPLFHQCLGLAAMLEIALTQIDTYCKSHGLQIIGYYQANEHLDDKKPDQIAYKIGEKLHEINPNSFIMMVDNTKMDSMCKATALDLHVLSDNKWKDGGKWTLIGGAASLAIVSDLINGKTYQSLVDFDNHLDDITLDWLNITTNKMVEMVPT